MKHLKKYNESLLQVDICEKYHITNYTINSDGTVDVNDHVNLYKERLTKLPLIFNRVSGNFYCYNNNLTSLEGAPKFVGGNFYCHINQLTSLEGSPEYVGGDFYCGYNQIISFEGAPEYIGGQFYCNVNPVWQVWRLFYDYSKIELFNDYDIIRDDVIILDRLNSFLEDIGMPIIKRTEKYLRKISEYKCI